MILKTLQYFIAFIILLHCTGATQLASALSKDKSAFVGMINMTEEETKKEKESKEDTDTDKDLRYKQTALHTTLLNASTHTIFLDSKKRIEDQYLSDNPTPPPDYLLS